MKILSHFAILCVLSACTGGNLAALPPQNGNAAAPAIFQGVDPNDTPGGPILKSQDSVGGGLPAGYNWDILATPGPKDSPYRWDIR